MGVWVSSSHAVSAAPSSSGGGLLTLCPCSSVGSHPWETLLYELLQPTPSHRLQIFTMCSSMGSLHGVQCFRNGLLQHRSPTRVTGPARRPAPAWLLSTGPRVLPRACSSAGSPQGHGLLWGTSTRSSTVSSTGGRVDICSTMDLHVLQGDNLHHHGLHHGLQGNLCSGTWSTSFFTDLGVCTVVSLTYSHSSLPAAVAQQVLTLLEYVIPEMLPLSLIGSVWPAAAPSWSQLELPLSYMREASDIFSQKPLQSSPLPKPCHVNPIQSHI